MPAFQYFSIPPSTCFMTSHRVVYRATNLAQSLFGLPHQRSLSTMAQARDTHLGHYDTIIVGAGMSGLAAASRLFDDDSYKSGKRSLLVLEARDRIGGRIGSVRVNGNRLDTGANWIHGVGTEEKPNPLVNILPHKKLHEINSSVSFRPRERRLKSIIEATAEHDWVKLDSPGSSANDQSDGSDLVVPPDVASIIFGSLWGLIGSLHESAESTSGREAKDMSILKSIIQDEDYKAAFDMVPKEYHRVLRALPQFVEGMEAAPLMFQSAETDHDKPGMGLLEYAIEDFDGEQVFLRDGYTAVVEELGNQVIQKGHVKLGIEVKGVVWDRESIEVLTDAGAYTAANVVCSLPLGVLQHHIGTAVSHSALFFTPPLPAEKATAIRSLGFGTLDKIFLVYSSPWWTTKPWCDILKKGLTHTHFRRGPDDGETERDKGPSEPDALWGFTNELAGLEIDPATGSVASGVRAISIMNHRNLTGFPVLSCFVSCANARHIESLTDVGAGDVVHRSLFSWFGREPPRPEAVHVTRWAQDEYSRGSYSHMITGVSETKHRECFAEPLINEHGAQLRFAGEHTSRNHFATVHGALISGWREADAVLNQGT